MARPDRYLATINTPGYLPDINDDDPPMFETAQEAWAWLADERQREEDQYDSYPEYTDTYEVMRRLGEGEQPGIASEDVIGDDGVGTVYGESPHRIGPDGCSDSDDLGVAYSVSVAPRPDVTAREGAIEYLTHDESGEYTGWLDCPGSRYGRTGDDCAPIAFIHARIVAEANGEPITEEALDGAMSLVVNDHDDVESIIRERGTVRDLATLVDVLSH